MSVFSALKTHKVHVARFKENDQYGDPTYDEKVEIGVRVRERGFRDQKNGRYVDSFTKILTDEWEFKKTDAVWLPGADTADDSKALSPRIVITSSTMGIRLSSAEF